MFRPMKEVSNLSNINNEQLEHFSRTILEDFPDSLIVADQSGRIVTVNRQAEKTFGFTREEMIGQPLEILIPHEQRAKHAHHRQQFWNSPIKRPMGVDLELYGQTKDGKKFPVDISLSPVRTQDRHLVIAAVRDITLHKEIENKVKTIENKMYQNDKLASIGQLAAGIAHEINNPLGFINSNLFTLGEYLDSLTQRLTVFENLCAALKNKDYKVTDRILEQSNDLEEDLSLYTLKKDIDSLLSETKDGVDRIKKIVNDLRTFAREGRDTKRRVRIDEVIESILGIVSNEFKYKASLIKDYQPTPEVLCIPQKIGQVLINLLINASQAIETTGTITIRTFCRDQSICIEISDTGQGIAPENLKNLFTPFFTTKPVGQGTGLGLSVSYDIIKDHQGDISVKSEVGKGTAFTVILPCN